MYLLSATCSVLYVDDNPSDHFLFERAVKKTATPLQIQPFLSPALALAYLKNHQPDFILCDYDLGSTKGSDLVRAIRAIASLATLPIIMFTGSDGPNSVANSYCAGADYFLCKPKDQSRMAAIVRTLYACATAVPEHFRTLIYLAEYEPRPLTTRATAAVESLAAA